jgi:hypothetical protein
MCRLVFHHAKYMHNICYQVSVSFKCRRGEFARSIRTHQKSDQEKNASSEILHEKKTAHKINMKGFASICILIQIVTCQSSEAIATLQEPLFIIEEDLRIMPSPQPEIVETSIVTRFIGFWVDCNHDHDNHDIPNKNIRVNEQVQQYNREDEEPEKDQYSQSVTIETNKEAILESFRNYDRFANLAFCMFFILMICCIPWCVKKPPKKKIVISDSSNTQPIMIESKPIHELKV